MLPQNFKPLLAARLKLTPDDTLIPGQTHLTISYLASPKLDGIRCITSSQGHVLSRSLKPIPNIDINRILSQLQLSLDGELIIPGASFPEISSFVMSESTAGQPWQYHVFDWIDFPSLPFEQRLIQLKQKSARLPTSLQPYIQIVPHTLVRGESSILALNAAHLAAGFEGTMLRLPSAPYKFGRSTIKQGYLLKLKSLEDAEGLVIGVTQAFTNGNTPTTNELGYTSRSSHQVNLTPKAQLGALRVRVLNGPFTGTESEIGTGFTETQRMTLWQNPPIGAVCTFTYQLHGSKDKPRIPVFKSFRHRNDL